MKLKVTAKLRRNADGQIELDYGRDNIPSHRFGPGGYENDPEVQKTNWQELRQLKSQIIQKAYELIDSWKLRGKKIKDLFTDPSLKQYSYKIRSEIEKYLNSLGMLQVFKEAYGENISDWFHTGVIASTSSRKKLRITAGNPNRISIEVTYEDGNKSRTEFNGTLEDAKKYYIGQEFQFGDTDNHPDDLLVKAIDVREL